MNFYFINSPAKADIGFIYDKLHDFNTEYFGTLQQSEFCIFATGANGEYIAGLCGKIIFTIINIDYLWVSDSHRFNGLGKALIQEAEIEARNKGIKKLFVETYTFQAVEFYLKLGFNEVGRYTDYPKAGIDKVMLQKSLSNQQGVATHASVVLLYKSNPQLSNCR